MKLRITLYTLIILSLSVVSCQKDFLSEKPSKALLVPTTLSDFQDLMDNSSVFNIAPSLPVISSDDFYATDAAVNAYIDPCQKNSYIWAKDIDGGIALLDWNIPYQQIFYSNVILDGLTTLKSDAASQTEWNTVRGSALFHRAYAFYNLVQLFAPPYNRATAGGDLGIPLRLSSDVNIKSVRATVQQCYDQIMNDLTEAKTLLPAQSSFKTRPRQAAALALLARVNLNMENYEEAGSYANSCLQQNSELIDYNSLDSTASSPFPVTPATNDNPEIIFYSSLTSYTFAISTRATVDTLFYPLYSTNDLRRKLFFSSTALPYFKGRYTGSSLRLFGGLATDELYLIRAECYSRAGDFTNAMADLNTLLKKRWVKTVSYPVLTAIDAQDALNQVLMERRKELALRGLRWGDLRRLNKDQRFAKTLQRTYRGTTYTLPENDKRYTFPIPTQEVKVDGLQQNDR